MSSMRVLLLAATAALAFFPGLATGQTAKKDPPLLGSSLTWAVDRNFRTGSGSRRVTFTLTSAWAFGNYFGNLGTGNGDPRHKPGDRASTAESFTGTGQRFGQLCLWTCADTECRNKPPAPTCVDNDFEVQTHTLLTTCLPSEQRAETCLQGSQYSTLGGLVGYTAGNFTHTMTLAGDVVGVMAYLSFRRDSGISITTGEEFSLFGRYMLNAQGVPLPPDNSEFTDSGSPKSKFDWSPMLPKANGARKIEGNWKKCAPSTQTQYCTTDLDCTPPSVCGDKDVQYGGFGYFGQSILEQFAPIPSADLFGISTTFVQLCCSTCQATQAAIAGCSLTTSRLQNYYSPVTSFPLAIFQAASGGASDVNLKVADYDGHILRLLPMRQSSPRFGIASFGGIASADQADFDLGRYRFHDYSPATGPIVRLSATPSGWDVTQKTLRHVIEVQDYLWDDAGIEDMQATSLGTAASTFGITGADKPPTATSGGGTSSVVFSALFQGSKCNALSTPKWKPGIPTEVECLHNSPKACYAALEAQTGMSASQLEIVEAPGFLRVRRIETTCSDFSAIPLGKPEKVSFWTDGDSSSLCGIYGLDSPCGCCQHRAPCPATGVCPDSILRQKKCRFSAYNYDITHVGEQRVMCFMAKATYCNADGKFGGYESQKDCSIYGTDYSCYSSPLCVRFNIVGNKPKFMDPTPLTDNSQDSFGQFVKGRTDVAACLGSPLQLNIYAEDADQGDQVRIFVDDELRGPSSFFSKPQISPFESSCGKFEPYGAERQGDNILQDTIVHLLNAEFDSTITASLNPMIQWRTGNATQRMKYTLDVDARNGVETMGYPSCGNLQTCRQQLLNMNRILCGYAYDNSRSRYARWVGARPEPGILKGTKDYLDDHSYGSYASDRHCWRIKLQAPPVFVTNATGCLYTVLNANGNGVYVRSTCTPFGHNPGSTRDTTKNKRSYPNITMSALDELDVTFYAYDPNPEDRVQLFVMEDPGVPPNMKVGRSTCIPRTAKTSSLDSNSQTCNTNVCGAGESKCECSFDASCDPGQLEVPTSITKCGFCDTSASNPLKCDSKLNSKCKQKCSQETESQCDCTGFCPADLTCNHASLRLQWIPDKKDYGKSFLVCVIARDNSNLCHAQGVKGATALGWYSEQHCMYLQVVKPQFQLVGPWVEKYIMGTSKEKPLGVYVGCTFQVTLQILEVTVGASYGGQMLRCEDTNDCTSKAPGMAMEGATNRKGEKKLVVSTPICSDISSAICEVEVSITPNLGSEGFYFSYCLAVGDAQKMISPFSTGVCSEDGTRSPCNRDTDCKFGECLPLCFDVRVEKCRYCIKDGPETLRAVNNQYMFDTNWMRIWTLNADTFGKLRTECPDGFDCDNSRRDEVAIDNPELIIRSKNGAGKRILWTGVFYNPVEPETASEIACRFRSGLRSMQHNNPEMLIGNGSLVIEPGYSVCMGACDAGTLLEQDAIPACQGIE